MGGPGEEKQKDFFLGGGGGCVMSQQHASVSQEQICSISTCCHTEIEVADHTSLIHSILTPGQPAQHWPYNARHQAGQPLGYDSTLKIPNGTSGNRTPDLTLWACHAMYSTNGHVMVLIFLCSTMRQSTPIFHHGIDCGVLPTIHRQAGHGVPPVSTVAQDLLSFLYSTAGRYATIVFHSRSW